MNIGNLDPGIPIQKDAYSDRYGSMTMSQFKSLSVFLKEFFNIIGWRDGFELPGVNLFPPFNGN